MTIQEALGSAAKLLSPHSSTARLDAEVLLAHVLRTTRASLLAHGSDPLPADQASLFSTILARRERGEPVAYITGHKEFYGLDLLVTPDVLVPRPETESAVEACLEIIGKGEGKRVADIGTGTGAIIIAIGLHAPGARLFATEISPAAIRVARSNVEMHHLGHRVDLRMGHLLEPFKGSQFDLIAANLPYVPPGEAAPDVAEWEPNVAVFGGGDDGTALIKEFLGAAGAYLSPNGAIIMETAHSQGALVSGFASLAFPHAHIEVRKDLAGYDRIVIVRT